jgi:protein required for attachment to host cells
LRRRALAGEPASPDRERRPGRPRRVRLARREFDMAKFAIPHDAFVFVGDGRKALFLRNAGDEKFPNLATERVFVDVNPATREQGTDRPGRGFASAQATRRSAKETTDWHEIEEHRFAARVAAALETLVRARGAPALVVVAPPRTLADLRRALHADVKARILGEIDKDLTKSPVWEIERHIAG